MPSTSQQQAPSLLLMSPEDNCLIARHDLKAGDTVAADGASFTLPGDVRLGHKVARRLVRAGDKVIRYGAIIGTATADIPPGSHIHTHNLASDYIPTHTIGEHHHE